MLATVTAGAENELVVVAHECEGAGHLLVGERLLGFSDPGSVFTEMIQLGSVLAIMWLYRVKILQTIAGLSTTSQGSAVVVSGHDTVDGQCPDQARPFPGLMFGGGRWAFRRGVGF